MGPVDLKRERIRKGQDLRAVGERMGMDARTLAAIEGGELRATELFLDQWAEVLRRLPHRRGYLRRLVARVLNAGRE